MIKIDGVPLTIKDAASALLTGIDIYITDCDLKGIFAPKDETLYFWNCQLLHTIDATGAKYVEAHHCNGLVNVHAAKNATIKAVDCVKYKPNFGD